MSEETKKVTVDGVAVVRMADRIMAAVVEASESTLEVMMVVQALQMVCDEFFAAHDCDECRAQAEIAKEAQDKLRDIVRHMMAIRMAGEDLPPGHTRARGGAS